MSSTAQTHTFCFACHLVLQLSYSPTSSLIPSVLCHSTFLPFTSPPILSYPYSSPSFSSVLIPSSLRLHDKDSTSFLIPSVYSHFTFLSLSPPLISLLSLVFSIPLFLPHSRVISPLRNRFYNFHFLSHTFSPSSLHLFPSFSSYLPFILYSSPSLSSSPSLIPSSLHRSNKNVDAGRRTLSIISSARVVVVAVFNIILIRSPLTTP